MLVDEVILAGRKLKSFINKVSPMILEELTPNTLRSKTTFDGAIDTINEINVDAFILIIRYYSTLAIDFRQSLSESLNIKIDLATVTSVELISYAGLDDTKKLIFELIYIITILDGSTEN